MGLTETLKSGAGGTVLVGGSRLVEGLYCTFFGALGVLCFNIDLGVDFCSELTEVDVDADGCSDPAGSSELLSDRAAAPRGSSLAVLVLGRGTLAAPGSLGLTFS